MTSIIRIRALLPSIRRLEFSSRSGTGSRCDWSGAGQGRVKVCEGQVGSGVLRFHEEGRFTLAGQSQAVAFRNVYRWELEEDRLRLFHERRGEDAAVWLFDLVEAGDGGGLVAAEPHLCGKDRYTARLALIEDGFALDWRIQGPRKDEALAYRYFVN